jgi:hypothetical protein
VTLVGDREGQSRSLTGHYWTVTRLVRPPYLRSLGEATANGQFEFKGELAGMKHFTHIMLSSLIAAALLAC